MPFILILIGIVILLLLYFVCRLWYYFYFLKYKIFPVQINDIKVNDNIKTEPYYDRIIKATPRKPTHDEIIFLLKYKKFMNLPYVYSMCSPYKVLQTQKILENVIRKKIYGCLIEMGVWKGGMAMWMKCILNYYHNKRHIWLFDTFEYFPNPENNIDSSIHNLTKILFEQMPSINDVSNNFKKYGLLDETIHFVKGEFTQTISITNPGNIAILRLDSDYYESTMLALDTYYDKVTVGGYVIIDDYNNNFVACKNAVNDFRKRKIFLIRYKILTMKVYIGSNHNFGENELTLMIVLFNVSLDLTKFKKKEFSQSKNMLLNFRLISKKRTMRDSLVLFST